MVEQVEIKPTQETSDKPIEESKETRPEWLPEKFKSPEDMAKAYGELETKLGQTEPKQEQVKETKKDDLSIDNAEKAVENAGLNMDTLQQEYNESGQLNDKSYEALAKVGIPKDYVDAFIKGQEAIATQTANTLKQEVGGDEAYKNMMTWASENLNEAEINAYNRTVNGKDIEATKLAIEGIEPNLAKGDRPSTSNATGFRSWAEVTAAMSDPRYSKDVAYQADVQAKLKNSKL
jgi:plasmid maintenance system antidote protein VapI